MSKGLLFVIMKVNVGFGIVFSIFGFYNYMGFVILLRRCNIERYSKLFKIIRLLIEKIEVILSLIWNSVF